MNQFIKKEKSIIDAIQIKDITSEVLLEIGKEKKINISMEYSLVDGWLKVRTKHIDRIVYMTSWLIFEENGGTKIVINSDFNSKFEKMSNSNKV